MKKRIIPIITVLCVIILLMGCVDPGAKMNITTPEPQPMKTDSPSEETNAGQVVDNNNEGTTGDEQTNNSDEAIDDAEAALNEVVDLLDELDSILDESFDD